MMTVHLSYPLIPSTRRTPSGPAKREGYARAGRENDGNEEGMEDRKCTGVTDRETEASILR